MNRHICKLILAFLPWPWLPAFWAAAFYASGKQRASATQRLCTAALGGRRKDRGLLKLLLRQGGAVDFGLGREREDTVPLSLNISGTLFVIHLYWSATDGTSWGTTILLPLCQPSPCFHHPQSTRRIQSSPFPCGFPSALRHLLGEQRLPAAWEWERWWI